MSDQYISPTHLQAIERKLSQPTGLSDREIKALLESANYFRLWQKQPTIRNLQRFWRSYTLTD